jgi:undecaprenyl diphosphate synthase
MISNLPKHVGIIMDGNGRWANLRGLPRIEGHKRGAERTRDIIRASLDIGIEVLTLYAFSIENWKRPEDEVSMLMELLYSYLSDEIIEMLQEGVRFRMIGDRDRLPSRIQKLIEEAEKITASGKRMTLVTALSYGGKDEILRAIKKAIRMGITEEEIDETVFESLLDTHGLPPVDLIIRTSGEKRLSNFLLWQGAYAELYFTETLWPDFTREEFISAIQDYQRRERRFGRVLTDLRSYK